MPVLKRFPVLPPPQEQLVRALADEIERDSPDGLPYAPVIIEEQVLQRSNYHVTVIWDAWTNLPGDVRSAIILDAYRIAKGPEASLAITVALGLTHAEATKLGIDASSGDE